MFRGFNDEEKIKLVRSILSLAVSGMILFATITYAWYSMNIEQSANGLALTADYSECNVSYTVFKNNEPILTSQIFNGAKPGDIITYELEITNLKQSGMLSVQLMNISYENSVLIDGIQRDIRDAYAVTLLSPYQSTAISLGSKTNLDVISNYPIAQNGVVSVKFNLEFLTNPSNIPDVNVFQGSFMLKIGTLNISVE